MSHPRDSHPDADPLADAVRDHYRQLTVRPQVADRLIELAVSESRTPGARRVWLLSAVAVAAVAAIAVVALLAGRPAPGANPGQVVAAEIALNHRKALAVEFPTDSYPALAAQMHKLDFALASPAPPENHDLLGGRYCSVRGSIAAQLKLRDRSGRTFTLYQTRWTPDYAGLADREIVVDGVNVRFWRQGDVLYGLAGTHSQ